MNLRIILSTTCAAFNRSRRRTLTYTRFMARGWESKGIEDQIAAAEERKTGPKRHRTPEELERESRRLGLLLSRAKIVGDIEHARGDRHRASLQQALDYIDAQITAL